MESKNLGALVLIIFGAYLLVRNLNILPRPEIIWPLVLIALGLVALYRADPKTYRKTTPSGEVIWEVNGNSPLFKVLVAIPALFIALIVGLIVLGLLGPFFLLFLLFIPAILFIKLGWAFVRLLVPIAFAAAPLLFIIWLLALVF